MLSNPRIPQSNVFSDITDTEQAIAGTQYLDLITVTHQRVVELDGFTKGSKIDGIKLGFLSENDADVGLKFDRLFDVQDDELGAINQELP